MVYKWKVGGHHVDATKTGEYFEQLEARDGSVKAEVVLNEARNKKALLHPAFEWDDNVAAEKFRLDQSRKLIGDLVCVTVRQNGEKPESQAFVNVVSHPSVAEYKSVSVAMGNETMRDTILANALKELKAFQAKYSTLSELGEVFKAIDALSA